MQLRLRMHKLSVTVGMHPSRRLAYLPVAHSRTHYLLIIHRVHLTRIFQQPPSPLHREGTFPYYFSFVLTHLLSLVTSLAAYQNVKTLKTRIKYVKTINPILGNKNLNPTNRVLAS